MGLLLPAAAPTGPTDPASAFDASWRQLPGHDGWQVLVSPPFPRTWPPVPGRPGAVVRYAFAMRLRPGLADGAEMAEPWARSVQDQSGRIVVERMADRLQPLGIQGVRPMRAGEGELAGREGEVEALLRAGGSRAEDGLVRAVLCGWAGRLGVVAAVVLPRHPAFRRWLAC